MTPAAWSDVGVVGLLIVAFVALIISVVRGWIVLGWLHKDITGELRGVVSAQAETIRMQDGTIDAQAKTLMKLSADADLGVKVLESVRELVRERAR